MGTTTDSPGMGQAGTKAGQPGKNREVQGQSANTGPQEETFYGVHIPNCNSDDFLHVYTDKREALNVVKGHKKARFKPFRSRSEAVDFAVRGSENVNGSVNQSNNAAVTTPTTTTSVSETEKLSLFKGPKTQEMLRFRHVIEDGDVQLVRKIVWDNPRFLISSGDTPSILQEGSRYNALHVAAKHKDPAMTELILETVGNPAFCHMLHDTSDASYEQNINVDRAAVLLDLYLNTPDKGGHETPLHFASKFGALEVVAVLVSYAQCDRQRKNKYGQMPQDIVCLRDPLADNEMKQKILALLENDYYVPVLRAQDNSVQPTVGQPFSPKEPLVLNMDPVSPRMEIHAFAGPMREDQAGEFHRQWRTPQRNRKALTDSPNYPKSCPPVFRLRDTEKGLERAGRELAAQHHVPWKEYWPFLDTFTDLASAEGLKLLEQYLHQRFLGVQNPSGNVSGVEAGLLHSSNTDDEQDVILTAEHSLDSSGPEPEVVSPITQLCSYMKACTIMDDSVGSGQGCGSPVTSGCKTSGGYWSAFSSSPSLIYNFLNSKPKSPERSTVPESQSEAILNAMSQPTLSPFLNVEKSLQLFAKRISVSLHHIAACTPSPSCHIGESVRAVRAVLKPEVKRIQNLVGSFMEDARFVAVDYHLVHSRVATSVAERLVGQLLPEERERFYHCLQDVASTKGVLDNTLSSDEEEGCIPSSTPYRLPSNRLRNSGSTNQQAAMRCIASQMVWAFDRLPGSGPDGQSPLPPRPQIHTESECLEMWSDAYPCLCIWPANNQSNFSRGSRKTSSIKRSMNLSINSETRDNASRRLQFDEVLDVKEGDGSTDDTNGVNHSQGNTPDADGDTFFTPPSSPILPTVNITQVFEVDEDEMKDPDEGPKVFINGSEPTRVDLDVLNAISNCDITPGSHPHIYRWRHEVLLHPPTERDRWVGSSRKLPSTLSIPGTPTSFNVSIASKSPCVSNNGVLNSTPQWSRIIGAYSPHYKGMMSVDRGDCSPVRRLKKKKCEEK